MDELTVKAIGSVRCGVATQQDHGWGGLRSQLILRPEYAAGTQGLEDFSHLLVVTYLHQARFDPERDLVRRPRGLAEMPLAGIFAQRAKDRPNPIGVTAVRIVAVEPGVVTVAGLDAIDETPILDLKPYYPSYDLVPEAKVPPWVDALMRGYF
jgi:tRNA-Thr(GGU) m(6)t(6)A37 methyltransferase TsaA